MFNQYDPTRGKWNTPIKFKINPANAPITMEQMVKATMQNVSMLRLFVGDIPIEYGGITSRAPSKSPDGELVIGYLPATQFKAEYGDYWAYANLWWADYIYDANIAFNAERVNTVEKFRSVQLHEWLHVLGFDHSQEKTSILANKPYHTWEYQGLLRLVDMHALASIYSSIHRQSQHPFSSLRARICVTDSHRLYIPCVVHPGTGESFSVEMRFVGRINNMMRFTVERLDPVPDHLDPRVYAVVSGERLDLLEVFNFGTMANVTMQMVDGDDRSWELTSVEYLN